MPANGVAGNAAFVKKLHELLLELLDDFKEEQLAIGHAGESMSLGDVR